MVIVGQASGHVPVMLGQVADLLGPALAEDGAVLLDATLGRAGHTRALLAAYPGLMVIGIDADTTAIEESRQALAGDAGRVTLVHSFYDEIPAIVATAGLDSVQGVLFDLGVSSPQLDDRERGFAYSYDAPLDMRMDQSAELTAEEIVNHYSAGELARVLREYGEERFARRIADALVRERSKAPVTSTARLSEIVRDSIPAAARRTGGHPAKRTFQALRIEVNGELAVLGRALPAALDLLSVGGRIAVLAYHSLEDRVVKRALAGAAADTTPPGLPVPLPDSGPRFRLLTRGAQRPDANELAANPRAASARLRAAERIRKAA
ncbi:MAG TPA: 16S rRNA (cytosine(1402)-N(4))-methyltransferase RsmH [Streptosporangiaceae bacterium]|nr:16S rRNA (cytosine(1402)-N(4))-methyltransferase RsmH [Streptosporangiaceae bacterium]